MSYELGALLTPPAILAKAQVFGNLRAATTESIPETLDLRPQLMPVRNQGNQGSCVAFSLAAVFEYYANKHRRAKKEFSPQFIYNCRIPRNISGMYLSYATKFVCEHGCPYETSYRYGNTTDQSIEDISPKVVNEAKEWRLVRPILIQTIEELKSALFLYGVCIAALEVYNYGKFFWKSGNSFIGNHCIAVVGYDRTGFIIRNSWGNTWGDFGHTHIRYEEFDAFKEIWAVSCNPNTFPDDIEDDKPKCCNIL